MSARCVFLISLLPGAIALALPLAAPAQAPARNNTIAAPDYGSGASAGSLSDANFNTPEADGRPGVEYFTLGTQAFRKGDYRHAIDMYRIAASWAYKPAEYNLALIYFKGQGVPVDRSLGAAWMVLAAERADPLYVRARDMMITLLSNTEFNRTDELWGQLKQTFGDKVALRRAKAQWALVRSQKTGSRVGGATGALSIGVLSTGNTPSSVDASGMATHIITNAFELQEDGSIDGSIAYRQFRQSDNPYDPVFLKNHTGNVTVEPLQPVKPEKAKKDGQGKGGSVRPKPTHNA